MRLGIVGCGYVADYYVKTLRLHPELEIIAAFDRDAARAKRFTEYHSIGRRESLEALLDERGIDVVLNLTNPRSHFEVSKACLEAGKHVYSEKPLAPELAQARELVELASRNDLLISAAPCSVLNESAQTMWKALREDRIGKIRLVYAEMDDGLVHRKAYRKWISESGTPWPYKDEFETGCTVEHAGYVVTWLAAFFGPAESVTAYSCCLIPEKGTDVPLEVTAPDFSLACIRYRSGVVARLTCSIIAPNDHSIRIHGDEGTLSVDDCWDDRSPIRIRRFFTIGRSTRYLPWSRRYPLVGKGQPRVRYRGAQNRDFCRGVAELAAAIREGRESRLSARFCLHTTETILAIQDAGERSSTHQISTTFDPIEPMPYANG